MQWAGREEYGLCVYCCLVTFISACITPGLKYPRQKKSPASSLCGTTAFRKSVCVCVFEKRSRLLYHRHPDTARIESERQWREAKETIRLSWPLRELRQTVIIHPGGVGGWSGGGWGGVSKGVRAFSGLDSANKGEEGKNSGAAEEDKTGKMKRGGPASGSVRSCCDYSSFLSFITNQPPHFTVNALPHPHQCSSKWIRISLLSLLSTVSTLPALRWEFERWEFRFTSLH